MITSAPQSKDDEFDRRRKKYAIMMSLRAIAVLGAALSYHVSLGLAMGFVAAGVILPWCAVLVANDRPAKKRMARIGNVPARPERALPAAHDDDRVVDG